MDRKLAPDPEPESEQEPDSEDLTDEALDRLSTSMMTHSSWS